MTASIQRVRVRVEGVVQGVGFRPFVHRLAGELRARRASCSTTSAACVIEAEGEPAAIDALALRVW